MMRRACPTPQLEIGSGMSTQVVLSLSHFVHAREDAAGIKVWVRTHPEMEENELTHLRKIDCGADYRYF